MSAIFGLHDTDDSIKPLQRMLNEKYDLDLIVDGNIGKITQAALARFQKDNDCFEIDSIYGVYYGEKTQALTAPFIENKYLGEQDYSYAATILGVEVAAVKAFAKVESKEFGFLNNGFPVILFERHKFYKYVAHEFSTADLAECCKKNPDICNKTPGGYVGGKGEIARFNKAKTINPIGAMASCSWGFPQILASNYKECGFNNVANFVMAMMKSEKEQMLAFVNFIKSDAILHKAIIDKNWEIAAKRYNGPNYKSNNYSNKLSLAYNSFK